MITCYPQEQRRGRRRKVHVLTNQCSNILTGEIRRCSAATVVNMNDPVQRSVPVTTTMVRPKGKTYEPWTCRSVAGPKEDRSRSNSSSSFSFSSFFFFFLFLSLSPFPSPSSSSPSSSSIPPKKVQKRGKTPPSFLPKKDKTHKKTHQSSHRPDQPRSIILKPRRRIRTQQDRTRKRQQHARHDRRQEHFVNAHVGFGGSCATAEFDGFFGGVGVHDDGGILLSMMMMREMVGEMMGERHGFRGEKGLDLGGLVCLVS